MSDDDRNPALQWIGLFLAPAAFFVHLQVAYVLVPWACATRSPLWVHVGGLIAVAIALAGAAAAWSVQGGTAAHADEDRAGPSPRSHFLGTVGLYMSALFALILAAQWVAGFVISPCQ
jgi:hypothetical protein